MVLFTLVNKECAISKILNEQGMKDFRILGIHPMGGAVSHLVEVPERGAHA